MKKNQLYFILSIFLAVISYNLLFNNNRNDENYQNKSKTVESKSIDSTEIIDAFETDRSDTNEIIDGEIYRNTKYKFSIKFPQNWSIEKGQQQNVVVKAIQADSGKTITVVVMENKLVKMSEKPKLTDSLIKKMKEDLISDFAIQNVVPKNITINDGYLHNFPAHIMTFTVINKTGEEEFEYKIKNIQTVVNGIFYQLSFSSPTFLMTREDENLQRNVTNSFKFELKYQYK